MKVVTKRLLEEQIAVVVVLESGKKDDAMWHVPQCIAIKDIVQLTKDSNMPHFLYDVQLSSWLVMLIQTADTRINYRI